MACYLLLPAKDEAEALSALIPEARREGLEVVVCDDGSTDATAEVAEREGALVLRHPRNLGLAEALRTLLDWAVNSLEERDVVVLADADGTMLPKDARRIGEAVELLVADVVIGSRFRPGGGEIGVPPVRRLLSFGARLYLGLTLGIAGVTDYTTGFRGYRVGFLKRYKEAFPHWFESRGFTAQTELLLLAYYRLGARVAEIGAPIRYDRKKGASKMRILRTARAYLELGWRGLALRRGREPEPALKP